MNPIRVIALSSLTFLLGLGAGLLVESAPAQHAHPPDAVYQQLSLFSQALHLIRTQHIDPPEPEVLIEEAIRGMTRALDEHSSYLTPELLHLLKEDTSGHYRGHGIELIDSEDGPKILGVVPNSPAAQQGLQVHDVILAIDGQELQHKSLEELVLQMRSADQNEHRLTIQRGDRIFDVDVEKAPVHIQPVTYEAIDDQILWVRLRQFNDETSDELKLLLREQLPKNTPKQLILDLRDNPGGLLEQAILTARLFLDEGTIVHVNDGTQGGKQRWEARSSSVVYRGDMVVLINEQSASASEILAAALRDNDRANIIGNRSFGKGTVQAVIPTINGGALKLSVTEYFGPFGYCIHQVGVTPDYSPTPEEPLDLDSIRCRSPQGLDPRVVEQRAPSPRTLPPTKDDPILALALDRLEELRQSEGTHTQAASP